MKQAKMLATGAAMASALALAGTACSNAANDREPTSNTGISAQALVSDGTDVESIRFEVTAVSCDDGSPIGATTIDSASLDPDQTVPGDAENLRDNPLAAGSAHLFADSFVVVPAGCYDVRATPVDSDGEDSDDCAAAFKKGVLVVAGETTEIVLINQCTGESPGAIDAVAALNHPPVLEDVGFTDSKFSCGTPTEVCAAARDPDGDPLEFVLVSEDCAVAASASDSDGEQCWEVTCHAPGRHDMTVTVYDRLYGDEGPERIEDYLAEQGYPNDSRAQLAFLAYVDGDALYPDSDQDGHGDAGADATVFCSGDDTTGFVDSDDDCDDSNPDAFPGNTETCLDSVDNDCDGERDEGCAVDDISLVGRGIGLTSAGVGLASRQGPVLSSATISLAGLPAGATVERALLYWMIIGTPAPDTEIELDGVARTGTIISFGEDTCWGKEGNATLGVDVTSAVAAKGNGSYELRGFPAGPNNIGDDGQGASLFVVFSDPTDARTNLVRLQAGLGVINEGGEHMTNLFNGLSVGPSVDSATLHNAVGDGQNFTDRLLANGSLIDGVDAFPGAQGMFWDNRVDDVTSLVASGDTSFSTDINIDPGSDCLAWAVNAVNITNYQ